MKKFLMALAAAAVTLPSTTMLVEPAMAKPHKHYNKHYRQSAYNAHGQYAQPRRLTRNDRVWRGNDGNYHCRRGNGTTGLIIGGATGALLGNVVDGGHQRTLGTLVGAAGGALLGRSIDRGDMRCR